MLLPGANIKKKSKVHHWFPSWVGFDSWFSEVRSQRAKGETITAQKQNTELLLQKFRDRNALTIVVNVYNCLK